MFSNIIEFKCNKDFIESQKDNLPIPAKLNIPQWYKEMSHKVNQRTIKGCMPFLDTLTTGYLLKMPVDYHIRHNINIDGEKITDYLSTSGECFDPVIKASTNLNYGDTFHPIEQLGKCPYVEKNKKLKIHKIHNPWLIKTPPGYSTLFLPPMNNADDRFSIIPGIVDTDEFDMEVNFPFVVNGDKYDSLETTIKYGTPYVQVIPFKREKWSMKVVENKKRFSKRHFSFTKYLLDNYKKRYWKVKKWK
tara:strand:+ start:1611 stop:2351 length:741 start_codon:yes stop_codon:yes gene_type:complete